MQSGEEGWLGDTHLLFMNSTLCHTCMHTFMHTSLQAAEAATHTLLTINIVQWVSIRAPSERPLPRVVMGDRYKVCGDRCHLSWVDDNGDVDISGRCKLPELRHGMVLD